MNHSTTLTPPVTESGAVPRSFRRVVATLATAALAGGMIVAVAAPASAAPVAAVTGTVTDGTFHWSVSERVHSHLSTQTGTDGATIGDAGVTTWTDGTGTVDTLTGASDVSYQGTAKYAFAHPVTKAEVYSVTVSDPEVVVDASGAGKIIADISYYVSGDPIDQRSTNDVVVTRFTTGQDDTDDWSLDGDVAYLTDTPAWDNVIIPGSADATEVGLTNGELPLGGQSFSKEFLLALPSSLRAHFYASGTTASPTASNLIKDPDPFTAEATVVNPTIGATVATYNTGVRVSITGNGFRGVTNPGDAGIYVAVAKAGGITDYGSSNMGSFLGTRWVNAAALSTGAFDVTLTTIDEAKLDPAVSYSVYTWQSHTHSNTSQDTETPITINYADFKNVEVALALSKTSSPYGKAVTATATVPGATGDVNFYVGEKLVGTKALADSVATLALPAKTALGTSSITATFMGTDALNSASSSTDLKVVKATTSKVTVSGKAFKKNTKPKVTVKIAKLNNGAYASGTVRLYVNGKYSKSVKFSTAKKGTISVTFNKRSTKLKVKAVLVATSTVDSKTSASVTIKTK